MILQQWLRRLQYFCLNNLYWCVPTIILHYNFTGFIYYFIFYFTLNGIQLLLVGIN